MVINSLLDNDAYQFFMQQATYHHFPDAITTTKFKCRNADKVNLVPYKEEIEEGIMDLGKLRVPLHELDFLRNIRFTKRSYTDSLRNFRLYPEDDVTITVKNKNELHISYTGREYDMLLYETPILAIISEIWSNHHHNASAKDICMLNLHRKLDLLREYIPKTKTGVIFADFGTRRRYSYKFHDMIIKELIKENPSIYPHKFIGTSNMYFAKKYNIKFIGTQAHRWYMMGQGLKEKTSLKYSHRYMCQVWADEYRGDLGIVLSDTIGFDAFLRDFDSYFAKLYDGCRHDSGPPDWWTDKFISHYESLNIPPITKQAVYSDGQKFPEAIRIHKKYCEKIGISYGIGTNLTNDCGITPPQIVLKMTSCNGYPVAKIADSKGKQMCEDPVHVKNLATQLDIPLERIQE